MSINTSFDYYAYRFVQNYYANDNSLSKKLYSFKSTKTNQTYFISHEKLLFREISNVFIFITQNKFAK